MHQLQVVDDDQAFFLVAKLTARLRAHLEQRETGGVVDVELKPRQRCRRIHDGVPVSLFQIASPQLTEIDAGFRA